MPDIASLQIQLDYLAPPVWREVEVPLDIGLDRLHLVIQAAMGWENSHLYEFRLGRTLRVVERNAYDDMGNGETFLARRTSLAALLGRITTKIKTFKYTYDFGDDWQHTIKLKAISEADPHTAYPRLISAERACPPEDCGGPPGYEHYLEAIGDPNHPDHKDMIEWRGRSFDPEVVDLQALQFGVSSLARRSRSGKS